jgi:sialate O-acetylesterase
MALRLTFAAQLTRRSTMLRKRWSVPVLAVLTVLAQAALADVRLPRIFGSDMVLQRDVPLPVWGWADNGEKVTVSVDGGAATEATANDKGEWMVKLAAIPAGGPHKLTIAGKNAIELSNVLAGEVWICSGQSNMEMGIKMAKNGAAEVAAANHPTIRLFMVEKKTSGIPLNDVSGTWKVCTPQSVAAGGWGGFSAAAYYFGREINKELNVPVGLVDTSWGGTRIEPWIAPQGFASNSALKSIVDRIAAADAEYARIVMPALDRLEMAVQEAKKAAAEGKAIPALPPLPKHPLDNEQQPTGLYNAMVKGFVPLAVRGTIWYQGESNNGEGMLYYEKMKALIGGWRQVFNNEQMPFLFVQLAPYRYNRPETLPAIWEAQAATLSVPNTGMAVITDVATVNDIHPPDKQTVGHRLALWALANTYGKKDLVYSGPIYKSMKVEGNKVRVSFEHSGTGLASRDGKDLTWFEIAGADKAYHPAKAVIEGNEVVVSSDEVKDPTAVRFGWSELAEPNLMNKEGLPASAFRNDGPVK